jgi:hypothetical protein
VRPQGRKAEIDRAGHKGDTDHLRPFDGVLLSMMIVATMLVRSRGDGPVQRLVYQGRRSGVFVLQVHD